MPVTCGVAPFLRAIGRVGCVPFNCLDWTSKPSANRLGISELKSSRSTCAAGLAQLNCLPLMMPIRRVWGPHWGPLQTWQFSVRRNCVVFGVHCEPVSAHQFSVVRYSPGDCFPKTRGAQAKGPSVAFWSVRYFASAINANVSASPHSRGPMIRQTSRPAESYSTVIGRLGAS